MRTKTEIITFLENLVHQRVSEETLNTKLSEFFDRKIEVYNASQGRIDTGEDDDELADYNLMFNIESGYDSDSGFYDIYMLPMRRPGWNDADMYITEVGYEFT